MLPEPDGCCPAVPGHFLPAARLWQSRGLPELPDITVYIEAIEKRTLGLNLEEIRLGSPFLLRTTAPPIAAAHNQPVAAVRRIGKRIAIGLDNGIWLVLHLMIAGRLHWHEPRKRPKPDGRRTLASFDFSSGSLSLTEAGSRKRASLHVVEGEAGLEQLDPGGLDVLTAPLAEFAARLGLRTHTLKRVLTDPRLFSGIGNAYSDEILHHAKLSPLAHSTKLTPAQISTLYESTQWVLKDWTERLRKEAGGRFPEHVTAFREGMNAHGRYDNPCNVCLAKIQRIRYADNETNYCPRCQTGGKVLADRGLSKLLGEDWPRTLEELEQLGKA